MNAYYCQACDESLAYVDYIRSPFCKKPNCQRAKAQHYLNESKNKIIQTVTKEVSNACKEYLTSYAGTINEEKKEAKKPINLKNITSAHITILPTNNRPLVKLAKRQKNIFLSHLKSIYIDIVEGRSPSAKVYTAQIAKPLNENENQLLGKACATCEGDCCSLGRNHAFQDMTSLKHVLNQQTDMLNFEDLCELYGQYFPKEHYQNACIFQGNLGCTLPRDLRSFTCNNYRCDSLRNYHQMLMDNHH